VIKTAHGHLCLPAAAILRPWLTRFVPLPARRVLFPPGRRIRLDVRVRDPFTSGFHEPHVPRTLAPPAPPNRTRPRVWHGAPPPHWSPWHLRFVLATSPMPLRGGPNGSTRGPFSASCSRTVLICHSQPAGIHGRRTPNEPGQDESRDLPRPFVPVTPPLEAPPASVRSVGT